MGEASLTVVATKRDALDPYIKILQTRSNDIDVSFSSFLKPESNNQQQQKDQEDNELSIFEARSYFSESVSNDGSQARFSSVSSAKVSSFTVGNKASSEVSWNSQTGLLSNKNRQQPDRGSSKKGFGQRWFFRRRTCPCSSSKSVQVQETKPRIAEARTGSDRVVSNRIVHHNHQTITSSDPIRLTIPSKTVTQFTDYPANRESRTPVSNFTFPTLNQTSEKANNPVKPVLNPVKPVLSPTSPKDITTEEEAASDASSDLFEIEGFSTQPVAGPWAPPPTDVVRNSIDESVTEYGYEPSEASVTWSVTTVEPASAVSTMIPNYARVSLSQTLALNGCDKKRHGLLNYRCEKAVMVNNGQRLIQPFKSASIQDEVAEKVLCNNGSSKLSLTSRAML